MGFVFCPHGSAQPFNTNQGSNSTNMSFWQENYAFIKEVYEMRHMKMAEWMENVEKSIARIMADKVYTSSEFNRERDTFNSLCKDLERAEVRKWLQQILEILMAERAKIRRTLSLESSTPSSRSTRSSSPMSRRPLSWWTSTGSATPMVMN